MTTLQTTFSENMTTQPFIIISGNIGAGKTTLAHKLAKDLRLQSHFESVSCNPYLEDFYHDMTRWSFPLQVYFLNHRFKTHRQIVASEIGAIQDRSIYEDANIFARALLDQGNMSKRDYENYLELYHSMIDFLPKPSLMIFLRRSVDGLMNRIKKRGRDYESEISRDYISHLSNLYDFWVNNYNFGPKLVIETDNRDFLYNAIDYAYLLKQIYQKVYIPPQQLTIC